jgi:hypothetical protein
MTTKSILCVGAANLLAGGLGAGPCSYAGRSAPSLQGAAVRGWPAAVQEADSCAELGTFLLEHWNMHWTAVLPPSLVAQPAWRQLVRDHCTITTPAGGQCALRHTLGHALGMAALRADGELPTAAEATLTGRARPSCACGGRLPKWRRPARRC